MSQDSAYDAMFSGVIGQDYQMLKLICPFATEMSRLVGVAVGEYAQTQTTAINVVELGGGTGITTLSILSADQNLKLLSVDNEPSFTRVNPVFTTLNPNTKLEKPFNLRE